VCGIPQVLYTDHGSDFTSRHIEQVCVDLKIQRQTTDTLRLGGDCAETCPTG
jgi:transposase InsO family protein